MTPLFTIEHNSIFTWKGFASFKEQEYADKWDSFCQLIIAQDDDTRIKWVIAIDQGWQTGTTITNCAAFLVPLVCSTFDLDIGFIRWIEVYKHSDETTIDEVVIKDVVQEYHNQPKIVFVWKPCKGEIRSAAERIIEAAGQIAIDNSNHACSWLKDFE